MSLRNLSYEQKQQFVGFLETICQELEITESQYKEAQRRYETIGNWLSESDDYRLMLSQIYPQGSIKLGTTVKPISHDEFDVDLVYHLKMVNGDTSPSAVNKLVGDRLRENQKYEEMMEPLKRGWRINYANEFHLDITPSIKNPKCQNGGELVPDRKLQDWKPSNPLGYAKWFEKHAQLKPLMFVEMAAKTEVEPFPGQSKFKGVLKRSVQLFKRHRDVYFKNKNNDIKPISIIITTLAAKSYKNCIENRTYANELDLLMDILEGMEIFIETYYFNGKQIYVVPNDTTEGENFAEKWNTDPRLAEAFYEWNKAAISLINNLWTLEGWDVITAKMSESFGAKVVHSAADKFTQAINDARKNKTLSVIHGIGFAANKGIKVPRNTFFGK